MCRKDACTGQYLVKEKMRAVEGFAVGFFWCVWFWLGFFFFGGSLGFLFNRFHRKRDFKVLGNTFNF